MTGPSRGLRVPVPTLGPFEPCTALDAVLGMDRVGDGWRNLASLLNMGGQIMGGQLAAHCLAAAAMDRPETAPASLHVLFLAGGDPTTAYDVACRTLRSGRTLSHHAVTVRQEDHVLVEATMVSAARNAAPAPGMQPYGRTPPVVAGPEACWPRADILAGHAADLAPCDQMLLRCYDFLEIADVEGFARLAAPSPGRTCFWLRIPLARGRPVLDHYALLTLATDLWYALPMYSHAPDRAVAMSSYIVTSVDHAVWFHRAPQCDEWMLFESELLVADGRGSVHRASVFDSSGNSVATVVQEGVARAVNNEGQAL